VGYMTSAETASTVWFSYKMDRPYLLEGPAGAGKTQLAVSISKVTGMKIVRLQCYPGIGADQAIGRYNLSLQQLFVLVNKDREIDFDQIRKQIMTRKFFITGPLLDAIEAKEKCILLIDEVDKVPHEFEAMLLELLSVWELSSPGLGTIQATTVPLTFLTSNNERILADPLRRRCLFTEIKHPTALLEAKIVAFKTSSLPVESHLFIAGFAQSLRTYPMKKHPSISEMSDIATAMQLMGLTVILPEHQEIFLPLLAKRPEDTKMLRLDSKFAAIVTQANDFVLQVKRKLAVKYGVLGAEILQITPEDLRLASCRPQIEAIEITQFPEEEMKQIEAESAAARAAKKGR